MNFNTEELHTMLDQLEAREGLAAASRAAQRHADNGRQHAATWLIKRAARLPAPIKPAPIAKGADPLDGWKKNIEFQADAGDAAKLEMAATWSVRHARTLTEKRAGIEAENQLATLSKADLKTPEGRAVYNDVVKGRRLSDARDESALDAMIEKYATAHNMTRAQATKAVLSSNEGRTMYNALRKAGA